MTHDLRRENLEQVVFRLGFDDETDENDPELTKLYKLARSEQPVARYACVMVETENESYSTAALVERLGEAQEMFERSYPAVVPQTVVDLDSGEDAADVEWEQIRKLRVSVEPK